MTATLLAEILSALCMAAASMALMLVAAVLLLGHAVTMDAEQREPRWRPALPDRYVPRVRGSSTSRTASPSTLTARIKPKSAPDAAARFHAMIGSRASSSRA
jgi:hypothetical protein